MRRLHRKVSKKTGLPPGSPVYIGKERSDEVTIEVIDYTSSKVVQKPVTNVEELAPFRDQKSVTWINVNGVHKTKTIEKLGEMYRLHPLVMEDIVNTNQRPKMEDFDSYVFVVAKTLAYDYKKKEVVVGQVSFIVSERFVITFQETDDVFSAIRRRIIVGKGRARKLGSDYLFYLLLDLLVDKYFATLEQIGDDIEFLEESLEEHKGEHVLFEIRRLKHELILLRKSVLPLREVLLAINRTESPILKKATKPYFRDVYDHVNQIVDTIKSFRDVVSGLLDVHLSIMSNKMNQIMKVLTIISTIFIPLTFLVGVYGTNFRHFPELEWKYAYPTLWIVMLAIAGVMVLYFRKNEWI